MLVIKLEIWPSGDKDRAREVGRAFAGNISALDELSDYIVFAQEGYNAVTKKPARNNTFQVNSHLRRQSVWALVAKIASQAAWEDASKASPPGDAKLYDVARDVCHEHGMDWTDPRTGKTHKAPPK